MSLAHRLVLSLSHCRHNGDVCCINKYIDGCYGKNQSSIGRG